MRAERVCAACGNFSRVGAFSSHHLTLSVAQVSRKKEKKKKKRDSFLSLSVCLCLVSLVHSDSRCCILMRRVSQGAEMRKSSPITRCPPAGQGQGLQQSDRWYCHPLLSFSFSLTPSHTHTERKRCSSEEEVIRRENHKLPDWTEEDLKGEKVLS